MADLFGQSDHGVRFDWGPTAARRLAADVSVVVDVLSFSTSVTVAVERGMRVFPYRWNDAGARAFAMGHDAALAVGRLDATRADSVAAPSLSPSSLLTCEAVPRVVLPSPNGSTIAAALLGTGSCVATGCLRNVRAVADWLLLQLEAGRSVAVIAAGERWPDGSLRPALEDQLGAGAILADLIAHGVGDCLSAEARVAAGVFEANVDRLAELLAGCVSGRELRGRGFGADVEVAGQLNVCSTVPVLVDGCFRPAFDDRQGSRSG